MNYQKIILAGNATSDARSQKSKKGDITFTTFGVAVSSTKDRKVFFPVTVFGKASARVQSYVTKGRMLLVEGHIEVSNTGRFSVVADNLQLGSSTEVSTKKT